MTPPTSFLLPPGFHGGRRSKLRLCRELGIFAASCSAPFSKPVSLASKRRGYTGRMNVRPDELPHREFYRILIGAVAPRPIAWVSTLSDGHLNLAPFSFFNVVSAKPPLLGFSPSLRQVNGRPAPKDTLRNIRETGEFVVNVVNLRRGRSHEPYQWRL